MEIQPQCEGNSCTNRVDAIASTSGLRVLLEPECCCERAIQASLGRGIGRTTTCEADVDENHEIARASHETDRVEA